MKDAISTKLLVMLAFAVAVAGFGAWSLLGSEEPTGDLGFGPDSGPSIVVAPAAVGLQPIEEPTTPGSRNPFERVDSSSAASEEETEPSDGEETDEGSTEPVPTTVPQPSTAIPLPEPVFPDPGIVDEASSGGSRGNPRDDQSFEG